MQTKIILFDFAGIIYLTVAFSKHLKLWVLATTPQRIVKSAHETTRVSHKIGKQQTKHFITR